MTLQRYIFFPNRSFFRNLFFALSLFHNLSIRFFINKYHVEFVFIRFLCNFAQIMINMDTLLLILVAVLPAALLWAYVWKKDKKKEPTSWLCKATIYGILICFPVAFIETAISTIMFSPYGGPTTLWGTTSMAFFVAAIPEELFKLFALWLVLVRNPYFDEHFDGIVYAVCVGLGFAAIENVHYLFGFRDEWMTVAAIRSLMAVPAHYAFAVLMGYYYSKYHFVDHSRKTAAMVIVAPVVCHGLYDALLMTSIVDEILGGVCVLVAIIGTIRLHIFARKKLLSMIETPQWEG